VTEIARSITFDSLKLTDNRGEHWSARDLMWVMGYGADWRNFADAVNRAAAACSNAGHDPADHIGDANKMVRIGSGAERAVADFRLSRFGAYLTAMNGDPRKPEIAAAQTYFAVKTREAEVAQQRMPTHAEALRGWASAIEEVEAVRQENAALQPAAAAWDHLASGDGDWAIADAAKILCRDPAIKTGRNRLFNVLHAWGWIYRASDGAWRAMQSQVDNGRISEIPMSHYHPRTGELVLDPPQVRIKPKGLVEIHRKLGGSKPLAVQRQLSLPA
jgi:DNA-damage-inducible protein D